MSGNLSGLRCIFACHRWIAIPFLIFLNVPTEAQSINDKPQPRIENFCGRRRRRLIAVTERMDVADLLGTVIQ